MDIRECETQCEKLVCFTGACKKPTTYCKKANFTDGQADTNFDLSKNQVEQEPLTVI